MRAALAEALRAIGEVIRQPRNAGKARMRAVQAMVRADHLRTLSLFELRMLPSHARESLTVPSVANVERLAGAGDPPGSVLDVLRANTERLFPR